MVESKHNALYSKYSHVWMPAFGVYVGLVGRQEEQPHRVSIPSQTVSLSSCARHPAQLWRGKKSTSAHSGRLKDQVPLLLSLVDDCWLQIPRFLRACTQVQISPHAQVINWVYG